MQWKTMKKKLAALEDEKLTPSQKQYKDEGLKLLEGPSTMSVKVYNILSELVKEDTGLETRMPFRMPSFQALECELLVGLNRDLRDGDPHERTARKIFGKGPNDNVSPEERTAAKVVNFAVTYGRVCDIPPMLVKEDANDDDEESTR